MEQFVRAIVGGGLALVSGLWLATLFNTVLGGGLALLGVGGLVWGIWTKVDR